MNLIAACLRRSIISNVNPLGGFGRTREAWNVESWQKCVCGTMWLRRHQGPGKRKRRRLLDPRFHGQLQPGGSRGQYGSRDHSNRLIMGFDSGVLLCNLEWFSWDVTFQAMNGDHLQFFANQGWNASFRCLVRIDERKYKVQVGARRGGGGVTLTLQQINEDFLHFSESVLAMIINVGFPQNLIRCTNAKYSKMIKGQ